MPELTLRRATRDDLDWLVELRNEPRSVRFSKRGVRSRPDIEHDYFDREAKFVHVALDEGGRSVGFGILEDLGDGVFEIGIAVHPEHRGRGLARPLVRCTGDLARTAHRARQVVATILPDNAASIRTFEGAGYVRDEGSSTEQQLIYRWWPAS